MKDRVAKPHKVLVVEDDASTREGLCLLLRDADYEAIGVDSVPSAFQALAEHRPDLVICDIRVEGENGLQLLATSRDRFPAIVLTGFDDPGLQSEAMELGADYLLKPVAPSLLLARIREKLAGTPPRS